MDNNVFAPWDAHHEQLKLYQLALTMLPGVGDALAKILVSYCGSPEGVFHEKSHLVKKIPGIQDKTTAAIKKRAVLKEAENEIKTYAKHNIRLLFYTEPAYPERLKQIYDAPPLLFYKGHTNLNQSKIISIVGTRTPTAYGFEVIDQLMPELAGHHPLIVSGLAYGIDIYAHRSALKHDLPTIGVMANGLDYIYPAVHRNTAVSMVKNGGLITENRFHTPPDSHRFPARNRIIAGMADATLIIEAREKGGALITADLAFDYDREVFAVPGNIHQEKSRGCNNLIKNQKAHLLDKIEDLDLMMGWQNKTQHVNAQNLKNQPLQEELAGDEGKVIRLLATQKHGMLIDDISWKSQVPINQLASLLLNLEFKGFVKSLPGRKFKLAR